MNLRKDEGPPAEAQNETAKAATPSASPTSGRYGLTPTGDAKGCSPNSKILSCEKSDPIDGIVEMGKEVFKQDFVGEVIAGKLYSAPNARSVVR